MALKVTGNEMLSKLSSSQFLFQRLDNGERSLN